MEQMSGCGITSCTARTATPAMMASSSAASSRVLAKDAGVTSKTEAGIVVVLVALATLIVVVVLVIHRY